VNSHGVNGQTASHAHHDMRRRPVADRSCARACRGRAWRIVVCWLVLPAFVPAPAVAEAVRTDSGSANAEAVKQGAGKPVAGKPAATTSGGAKSSGNADAAKPAAAAPQARFDIDEYRVEGADNLPQIEVEAAVYPFLGPKRGADDVEKARVALEKAYHDKGFQTVTVSVPQQDAQRGFVVLKVAESRVGRLRVKGSRYFNLDNIKQKAPSLQEGTLPDFGAVTKDIVALNRWPDRRVTPALRAGVTPGTVDVDLNVEDTNPIHGSLELNNRQSPSTTPLRLSTTLHYDNLWQLGHSLSFTYQVAPENPLDATVFSASYLARTDYSWLDVLVYGLKSSSSVATVGGANVVGPGQVVGARAVITLPTKGELFQTLSLGADYKNFEQTLTLNNSGFSSPVTYVPLVAAYTANWQGDGRLTQFNATITSGLRGIGSAPDDFDAKRFKATESFISLHADVSHTQDLPGGAQLFGKVQGQISDQALVSSEQLSLGGQDTIRGYLESEVLGDYGVAGTLELRTPNIAPYLEQKLDNPPGPPVKFNAFDEWRFFAFADAGLARIHDPLPDEAVQFNLASYGIGTKLKTLEHLNSIFFVGVPLTSQQVTLARHPRVSFRIWGEF
jgi:hemolysin activation/secretion protein